MDLTKISFVLDKRYAGIPVHFMRIETVEENHYVKNGSAVGAFILDGLENKFLYIDNKDFVILKITESEKTKHQLVQILFGEENVTLKPLSSNVTLKKAVYTAKELENIPIFSKVFINFTELTNEEILLEGNV